MLEIEKPDRRISFKEIKWFCISFEYSETEVIPGDKNTDTIDYYVAWNPLIEFRKDDDGWHWVGKSFNFKIYDNHYISVYYRRKHGETFKTPLDYVKWVRNIITTNCPICNEVVDNVLKNRPTREISELTEENVPKYISNSVVSKAIDDYINLGLNNKKYIYLYIISCHEGISDPLKEDLKENGFEKVSVPEQPMDIKRLDLLELYLSTRVPKIDKIMADATNELIERIKRERKGVTVKFGNCVLESDFEILVNGRRI